MSQFHIPRPRSDDGSLLPALLAGVMLALLAVQFAPTPLDEAHAPMMARAAVGRPTAALPVPATVADPVIRARPIFAPSRAMGSGTTASDPLAGAQVAGSWSVGRQTILVLRQADGRTRNLRIGQAVNQWLLSSVTAEGAQFVRDGQRIVIPFGGTAPQATTSEDPPEEEQ